MVGCARPNRWLVEPDSTAGFTQRALVKMKETAKALLSKNKNELPAARTLYVSLDRADNVIEGGPAFDSDGPNQPVAARFVKARTASVSEAETSNTFTSRVIRRSSLDLVLRL